MDIYKENGFDGLVSGLEDLVLDLEDMASTILTMTGVVEISSNIFKENH